MAPGPATVHPVSAPRGSLLRAQKVLVMGRGRPGARRAGRWGSSVRGLLWRLPGWCYLGRQVWLRRGLQNGQPVPSLGPEPGLGKGKVCFVLSALRPAPDGRLALPPSPASQLLSAHVWLGTTLPIPSRAARHSPSCCSLEAQSRVGCVLGPLSRMWTRRREGGELPAAGPGAH